MLQFLGGGGGAARASSVGVTAGRRRSSRRARRSRVQVAEELAGLAAFSEETKQPARDKLLGMQARGELGEI